MHKDNQKTQYNECLICHDHVLKHISIIHLFNHYPICINCMRQFDIINHTISFYHRPLTILYHYNDFFKSLLFQYKGQYDYALKDVFLALFLDKLKRKYKDYIIVVIPSSKEDNLKRGFAPMQCIALTLSENLFLGLYKKETYKQSDMRYEERKLVKDKIGILNGEVLKGKKILIMDDVLTSGMTLLSAIKLCEAYQPKLIECLVLSTGHFDELSVLK